jgi:hypothetical protein
LDVSAAVFQLLLSTLKEEMFGFKLKIPSYRLAMVETAVEELKTFEAFLSKSLQCVVQGPGIVISFSEEVAQLLGDISVLKGWTTTPDSLWPACTVGGFACYFRISANPRRVPREEFRKSVGKNPECEGHLNTLTVLLDTKGNVFGGFTSVG